MNTEQTEEQVHTTIKEPDVKLGKRLKDELLSEMLEESTVIVHCTFHAINDTGIRIWNNTVLIDKASGNRSAMHHAEKITIAPEWTLVLAGQRFRFTLIYAPLPKSCEFFDLLEDIPESGGFHVKNVKRNKSDVYHVNIG